MATPISANDVLSALSGLGGSYLKGKGGNGVKVTVATEQAASQQTGVSVNPVIMVSSPDATAAPKTGEVPVTGSPLSLSIPTYQTDTPTSLTPSYSLPSGNAAAVSPESGPGILSDLFDFSNPLFLALLGIGAYFLFAQGGK